MGFIEGKKWRCKECGELFSFEINLKYHHCAPLNIDDFLSDYTKKYLEKALT